MLVEIDGISHDMGSQQAVDAKRDQMFKRDGLRVLHIPARDILKDMPNVLDRIILVSINQAT